MNITFVALYFAKVQFIIFKSYDVAADQSSVIQCHDNMAIGSVHSFNTLTCRNLIPIQDLLLPVSVFHRQQILTALTLFIFCLVPAIDNTYSYM